MDANIQKLDNIPPLNYYFCKTRIGGIVKKFTKILLHKRIVVI